MSETDESETRDPHDDIVFGSEWAESSEIVRFGERELSVGDKIDWPSYGGMLIVESFSNSWDEPQALVYRDASNTMPTDAVPRHLGLRPGMQHSLADALDDGEASIDE